ncbi:hypothetical protein A1D23_08360 [Chelonobacter oris]|uniref:DUF3262 family protein n=1 Tax=Chelonobacter oris TaxID=505317 RepID=UPI00244BFD3B|nr:DUF3262 family protein [Chelonobacter oris]MDH3000193.1 hypothetical protein [Chelonobacter oris]
MADKKITPLEMFGQVSGMDPIALKLTLSVFFIAGLLLAYAWAVNSGFKGFSLGNRNIFDFLVFILKSAATILLVIIFFIY